MFRKKDAEFDFWNKIQSSYTLGHNQFSTVTDEEMSKFTSLKMDLADGDVQEGHFDDSNLLGAIDWRTKGGVNPVKNQGGCGSCWAFGATAVTENAHFIASGKLLTLSEQQLVDCVPSGCGGGWHGRALNYFKTTPQVLSSKYPYTAKTQACDPKKGSGGIVTVKTVTQVKAGSVSQHKAALDKGVLAIALAAGNSIFSGYKSGILDNTSCPTSVDHAVAMVGYGNSNGKDYWIVRNSWGTGWGDAGHIKIAAYEGSGICYSQVYSYAATSN